MKHRGKRPAYQHYPGDELRDSSVQLLGLAEFGLWRRMLNLMHDGEPYGHLADASGRAIEPKDLARLVGEPATTVTKALKRLEELKVFSRNDAGVIYSRRMVRDEANRNGQAIEGDASTRGPAQKRGGKTGALFNFLFDRYAGCLYCGSDRALELHRIVPGRHHGLYEPGNVLLLCHDDHMAVDHGELPVSAVLAKAGVVSAADLFAEFTDPRFARNTHPGNAVGIGGNTPRVSAAIPSSSAVAVCGLQSASAQTSDHSGRQSFRERTAVTLSAREGTDTAAPLRSLALESLLMDLAAPVRGFLERFYRRHSRADQERTRDVAITLLALQRGEAVIDHRKQAVRAYSLDRLVAKCRELQVAPPRDENAAIVVLLIKLGDTSDLAGSGQLPGQVDAKALAPTGPLDERVAGLIDGVAAARTLPSHLHKTPP